MGGAPTPKWDPIAKRVQVLPEDGFWGVKRGLSTSLEGAWTLWVGFDNHSQVTPFNEPDQKDTLLRVTLVAGAGRGGGERGVQRARGSAAGLSGGLLAMSIWLWVEHRYPKCNPGKWNRGLKPVVLQWFNFDPYLAVMFKTVLGSPFWLVGEFTTHFRTCFSGDWDVHWHTIWILAHGHFHLCEDVTKLVPLKWCLFFSFFFLGGSP